MRFARLAIPIAMLSLTVAACGGGSQVAVQEVPGGSVELTVNGGDQLAPKATATPTAEASETSTPESTDAPSETPATEQPVAPAQTAAPTQTTPQGTAGGGAAAPDANPTPPPGADAQQFEAFCQQNPGAC